MRNKDKYMHEKTAEISGFSMVAGEGLEPSTSDYQLGQFSHHMEWLKNAHFFLRTMISQ